MGSVMEVNKVLELLAPGSYHLATFQHVRRTLELYGVVLEQTPTFVTIFYSDGVERTIPKTIILSEDEFPHEILTFDEVPVEASAPLKEYHDAWKEYNNTCAAISKIRDDSAKAIGALEEAKTASDDVMVAILRELMEKTYPRHK